MGRTSSLSGADAMSVHATSNAAPSLKSKFDASEKSLFTVNVEDILLLENSLVHSTYVRMTDEEGQGGSVGAGGGGGGGGSSGQPVTSAEAHWKMLVSVMMRGLLQGLAVVVSAACILASVSALTHPAVGRLTMWLPLTPLSVFFFAMLLCTEIHLASVNYLTGGSPRVGRQALSVVFGAFVFLIAFYGSSAASGGSPFASLSFETYLVVMGITAFAVTRIVAAILNGVGSCATFREEITRAIGDGVLDVLSISAVTATAVLVVFLAAVICGGGVPCTGLSGLVGLSPLVLFGVVIPVVKSVFAVIVFVLSSAGLSRSQLHPHPHHHSHSHSHIISHSHSHKHSLARTKDQELDQLMKRGVLMPLSACFMDILISAPALMMLLRVPNTVDFAVASILATGVAVCFRVGYVWLLRRKMTTHVRVSMEDWVTANARRRFLMRERDRGEAGAGGAGGGMASGMSSMIAIKSTKSLPGSLLNEQLSADPSVVASLGPHAISLNPPVVANGGWTSRYGGNGSHRSSASVAAASILAIKSVRSVTVNAIDESDRQTIGSGSALGNANGAENDGYSVHTVLSRPPSIFSNNTSTMALKSKKTSLAETSDVEEGARVTNGDGESDRNNDDNDNRDDHDEQDDHDDDKEAGDSLGKDKDRTSENKDTRASLGESNDGSSLRTSKPKAPSTMAPTIISTETPHLHKSHQTLASQGDSSLGDAQTKDVDSPLATSEITLGGGPGRRAAGKEEAPSISSSSKKGNEVATTPGTAGVSVTPDDHQAIVDSSEQQQEQQQQLIERVDPAETHVAVERSSSEKRASAPALPSRTYPAEDERRDQFNSNMSVNSHFSGKVATMQRALPDDPSYTFAYASSSSPVSVAANTPGSTTTVLTNAPGGNTARALRGGGEGQLDSHAGRSSSTKAGSQVYPFYGNLATANPATFPTTSTLTPSHVTMEAFNYELLKDYSMSRYALLFSEVIVTPLLATFLALMLAPPVRLDSGSSLLWMDTGNSGMQYVSMVLRGLAVAVAAFVCNVLLLGLLEGRGSSDAEVGIAWEYGQQATIPTLSAVSPATSPKRGELKRIGASSNNYASTSGTNGALMSANSANSSVPAFAPKTAGGGAGSRWNTVSETSWKRQQVVSVEYLYRLISCHLDTRVLVHPPPVRFNSSSLKRVSASHPSLRNGANSGPVSGPASSLCLMTPWQMFCRNYVVIISFCVALGCLIGTVIMGCLIWLPQFSLVTCHLSASPVQSLFFGTLANC